MASATCMASSRVGASTRPWTSRTDGSTAASSGSPNAAVLPVPVCATPITSRPSSSEGIACSWIGEGERSEEHTSELQSRGHLVCRLLLEKKKSYTLNSNYYNQK